MFARSALVAMSVDMSSVSLRVSEEQCGLRRKKEDGAEAGTRTRMGCPTRPSNVRVYQFHHFGMTEL